MQQITAKCFAIWDNKGSGVATVEAVNDPLRCTDLGGSMHPETTILPPYPPELYSLDGPFFDSPEVAG
jgi:hypothetical protein